MLWELFLAGDGCLREGDPLLSELSVDVRASGDVKRREMPRERSRWSLSVVQIPRVSANITVRDLDLGAIVDDVWRLGSVANRLLLFGGVQLAVDTAPRVHTARRRVATPTCSSRGQSCAW